MFVFMKIRSVHHRVDPVGRRYGGADQLIGDHLISAFR